MSRPDDELAALAHDFNNLLGVILNYSSLVADEVAAALAGDTDRRWDVALADLEEVRRAAERATELTERLRGPRPPAPDG